MEQHKKLNGIEKYEINFSLNPHEYFQKAKKFAFDNYSDTINTILSTDFLKIDQDFFFREYIWVVHATGFSAKAVGSFLPKLLNKYFPIQHFSSLKKEDAINFIRPIINNPQKIEAIWKMSKILSNHTDDWGRYKNENLCDPDKLGKLPYIGKVTCYHLARNIGILNVIKPDLHLVRMAKHWGFSSPLELCESVKPKDLPLGIVDLILWYSASTFGTSEIRKNGDR